MKLFNFSKYQINKSLFNKPTEYNKELNKIEGGLWCGPFNPHYYSDWTIVEIIWSLLKKEPGLIAEGNMLYLKDDARVLTLTKDNFKNFDLSNVNKIVNLYDVIHYTQELVDAVEDFEAYYVESFQILNPDCIASDEHINIEQGVIGKYEVEVAEKMEYILHKIQNTKYVKNLMAKEKPGKGSR